jgi:hypothetical protein
MPLPSYDLSLQKIELNNDPPGSALINNINADELVTYINAIKNYIADNISSDVTGITSTQAKALIEAAKHIITLPVIWPTSTLYIDPSNPSLGTITRTNAANGSCSIVVTNVKNSKKIIVQMQSYAGDVVRPKINITSTYITITFARREDLDQTPGHTNTTTDPNIKYLIIS